MKKTLLLLVLLVAALSARATVAIDAAHFPDGNFRVFLVSLYPYGYITTEELESRTELDVGYKNISDLTGVAYFSNLKRLHCEYNNLTTLPPLPSGLEALYCYNNKLVSISGISSCASTLKRLECYSNSCLTSVDISNMPALFAISFSDCTELTDITCQNNPMLDDFHVDGCSKLTNLYCPNIDLRYLDLEGCTALKTLRCYNNRIWKIYNLDYCTSLTYLDCNNNSITSLPALPNSLKWLDCSDNQLTEMPTLPDNIEVADCSNNKISGNVLAISRTKLTTLDLSNNPSIKLISVGNDLALTYLGIEGCTRLKTLSMGNVPSYNFSNLTLPSYLEQFSCDNNNLTTLPELPESLKTLYCYDNQLTALPALPATIETVVAEKNRFTTLKINEKTNLQNLYVGNNPLLTELNCSYNALSALDISGCTALKTLLCNNNQLAALNVQGLAALEKVACGANQLTSLSFQGCNALSFVNCCHNQIKDSEMTAMIGSLRAMPAGTKGTLQVLASADEGNTITNAQVRAARNKGWIPYKWRLRDFYEITVEDEVLGDLDGSGNVDVDDLNLIINMMLDKNDKTDAADLNGDGNVDVDDLNAIINIILGKD